MRWLLLMVLCFCCPLTLLAQSGVKGRVAWRGVLVPGISIHVYRSIDAMVRDESVATVAATAQDGTYRIDLPPGRYYLTARSFERQPKPGDYFCYYSGAPVVVPAKGYRQVGFNLVRVPSEEPVEQVSRSGLRGEISFQDEPLEKVYLYVYKKTDSDFKGPAWFVQPVQNGNFRMSLPPGDYWLLARKRLKGGQYGPIEIGDYFNFYYGNPVHIDKGELKHIRLETITRLSMLEEDPDIEFSGIRGQVVGQDGSPAAGLRVFAYRSAAMSGTPAYISAVSDAEGQYRLEIPEAGSFWLLARERLGGPAATGELYGQLQQGRQAVILTEEKRSQDEVRIEVSPHP